MAKSPTGEPSRYTLADAVRNLPIPHTADPLLMEFYDAALAAASEYVRAAAAGAAPDALTEARAEGYEAGVLAERKVQAFRGGAAPTDVPTRTDGTIDTDALFNGLVKQWAAPASPAVREPMHELDQEGHAAIAAVVARYTHPASPSVRESIVNRLRALADRPHDGSTKDMVCAACTAKAVLTILTAEGERPHEYEPRDCGGACMVCGCGKSAHGERSSGASPAEPEWKSPLFRDYDLVKYAIADETMEVRRALGRLYRSALAEDEQVRRTRARGLLQLLLVGGGPLREAVAALGELAAEVEEQYHTPPGTPLRATLAPALKQANRALAALASERVEEAAEPDIITELREWRSSLGEGQGTIEVAWVRSKLDDLLASGVNPDLRKPEK